MSTAEEIAAACNVEGFPSLTSFGDAVSKAEKAQGVSEPAADDEEVALTYTFPDGSQLFVRTGYPDVVEVLTRQAPPVQARLVDSTDVPGGEVVTTAYSLPSGDFLQVEFVADAGGTYDPRRFSVASRLSREYYPAAEDAEHAAAAYHAQEVKRRRTFSAVWIGDMLLTGPEHAHLPLHKLVAVALAELDRRGLVDLDDREDRRRAILDLEIGEWTDPAGREG